MKPESWISFMIRARLFAETIPHRRSRRRPYAGRACWYPSKAMRMSPLYSLYLPAHGRWPRRICSVADRLCARQVVRELDTDVLEENLANVPASICFDAESHKASARQEHNSKVLWLGKSEQRS